MARIMDRIVILGGGFIGKSLANKLDTLSTEYLLLTRDDFDFEKKAEVDSFLKSKIKKNDNIIFTAAVAPVKNMEMFIKNMQIIKNICFFFSQNKVKHFLNISSDAIFSDSTKPLREDSITDPGSLHGLMHLVREKYIFEMVKSPITTVRPTLIYGFNDPHNSYGPNSFFRKVIENKNILLFGKGEELRDHIYIDDVINIIVKLISKGAHGRFNLVTGKLVSFKQIAEVIKKILKKNTKIIETKRSGKMPHNGYREFNNKILLDEIGPYNFVDIITGIKNMLNIKNEN